MGVKQKADPKTSAGAREERASFREMLRRRIKAASRLGRDTSQLDEVLNWVLGRQARYDAAPGGLGQKRAK